jgi:diguanylate cyclase (GGDEF)-like protein
MFGARLPSQQVLVAGLFCALLVWLAEVIVGPGALRHYIADAGWTGFSLAATVSTARAVLVPVRRERRAWICIFLGVLAWAIGQLFWDIYDIAGISAEPPVPSDFGFLAAAAFFVVGCVGFLADHERRLAVYALVLDVSAAVLTLVAGVALYVADLFGPAMIEEPVTLTVALAYPVLYVAATGAALSMFWGLPSARTRRAHLFLLIGVALNAVGFVLWLPDYVHESFVPGTILDPLWMVGILCIGIAGRQRAEESAGESTPAVPSEAVQLSRMLLPGVVALAAAGILVGSQIDHQTATDAIVAAAIALTIIVLSVRAGLALYSNWRLGIRERRRAAQFAALYDVGLATAGVISLDHLARLAVDNVIRLTQVDGAMIALADPDGSLVIRAINRSNMPQLRDDPGGPLIGVALESVRTREITVVPDYADHPDSNPRLHGTVAAALALPLIAGGELVGTITLYSGRQRHWGSETQRMFRLYAAQAAIAISNARLLGESRRLASHDPLTGLTNRRVLVERLEAEAAEARRHGDAFCVILCDVDGLKAVNDTAGHLVGDSVLRSVATTLRATARTEDVVARFGGDEFVLLLPRTALEAARALATRLANELPEQTYMWGGVPHALPRVSFGIAAFPDDGLLADQLIAKADERMYADKARARGRLG